MYVYSPQNFYFFIKFFFTVYYFKNTLENSVDPSQALQITMLLNTGL